mgnify:CR=1 FL=1
MKKLAIFFVSILVFSTSFANAANDEKGNVERAVMTTSVSGKVLDKITGEALVGVKISVDGTEKSAYTDFDGNFEIDGIREGKLEIKAQYISYKQKVEKVDVRLSKSNNIDVIIESVSE